MLHDSCIDKPTPDPFQCFEQVEFNKCFDPFMVSPLGAQWQGGFCQRTCGRCTCDPDEGAFCAEVGTIWTGFSVLCFFGMHVVEFIMIISFCEGFHA